MRIHASILKGPLPVTDASLPRGMKSSRPSKLKACPTLPGANQDLPVVRLPWLKPIMSWALVSPGHQWRISAAGVTDEPLGGVGAPATNCPLWLFVSTSIRPFVVWREWMFRLWATCGEVNASPIPAGAGRTRIGNWALHRPAAEKLNPSPQAIRSKP